MKTRTFVASEKDAFATSLRVELRGAHEHVTLWLRQQCVGTLVVGTGDGEKIAALLQLIEQQAVSLRH